MAGATLEKLSEGLAVAARIKPQAVTAAATVQSDVVDMFYFQRALFIFNFGDYAGGNNGSVAAGIYGDTTSGGSFTNLVTGKQLTDSNFTGSLGDDAAGIIEVNAEELLAQGFRYIRAKATPTNQNLTMDILGLAGDAKYGPAVNYDLAAVKQIV